MSGQTVLVTGAAGFIGSALVRTLLAQTDWNIVAFDALTYAGNPANLNELSVGARFKFVEGDICDVQAVKAAFSAHDPAKIFHLAAESHVDRSIDSAAEFIRTNVLGTQVLLDAARHHWGNRDDVRFIHISTDEVFGDLSMDDPPFDELTPYRPSSPYAASKAASDHLVRAAFRTHKLPVLISNCSNNYGPRQFPEKLIPLMLISALNAKPLPVYGDGSNRRDWLHVEDHAEALLAIAQRGTPGRTYCVGGGTEVSNLEVVHAICAQLDKLLPDGEGSKTRLITYVQDRPGHDRRYAIDATRIDTELGWSAKRKFNEALEETIQWYLDNAQWWEAIHAGTYRNERLGLNK